MDLSVWRRSPVRLHCGGMCGAILVQLRSSWRRYHGDPGLLEKSLFGQKQLYADVSTKEALPLVDLHDSQFNANGLQVLPNRTASRSRLMAARQISFDAVLFSIGLSIAFYDGISR